MLCLGHIHPEAEIIHKLSRDSRKIVEGVCAYDNMWNFVLDAKEQMTAALVGDPDAVTAKSFVVELILGFLEFKDLSFSG